MNDRTAVLAAIVVHPNAGTRVVREGGGETPVASIEGPRRESPVPAGLRHLCATNVSDADRAVLESRFEKRVEFPS